MQKGNAQDSVRWGWLPLLLESIPLSAQAERMEAGSGQCVGNRDHWPHLLRGRVTGCRDLRSGFPGQAGPHGASEHRSVTFAQGSAKPGPDHQGLLVPPHESRGGHSLLLTSSSCVRGTVWPNKRKRRNLEQRKVYCRALQGDGVAYVLKSSSFSEGFDDGEGFAGSVITSCTLG